MIDAIDAVLKTLALLLAVVVTAICGVLIFDAVKCGVYPVAAFFAANIAAVWVLVIDMIKH
jgi:hypothetical protein